jgi:pilus assembly protein CpaB
MTRHTRTFVVVGISVGLATLASFGVYRAVRNIPVREVPVAHQFTVVAARELPMGTLIAKDDVKLVPWPASDPLPGGFDTVDKVINRGLVAAVLKNEPLSESKLAPTEAGAGLPPTIPAGMRALSVKVNEVIGVAGFTVPGTRVDVLAMVRENNNAMSRIVVSNVQVLTSGTKYDQDQSRKDGQPIKTTVVTLAVTPSDAERIALAAADGQIVLALRNPLDAESIRTTGVKMAELMTGDAPLAAPVARPAAPRKAPAAKPAPAPAAAPAPAVVQPAPQPYRVEAYRASKRSEETVQ